MARLATGGPSWLWFETVEIGVAADTLKFPELWQIRRQVAGGSGAISVWRSGDKRRGALSVDEEMSLGGKTPVTKERAEVRNTQTFNAFEASASSHG